MSGSFRWHPQARLFDPTGAELWADMAAPAQLIADRPGGLALVQALAGQGAFAIRESAEGPPPAPGPVFETLTSGSSGQPRRIRRSQASWTTGFAVNSGLFGIGPGARLAVPGRLAHSLSLYGALEGLFLGAEVHLLDGLRPDRQAQALATRRISHLYVTPAQLRGIAAAKLSLPDLRLVLVGGSKLDMDLRAATALIAPAALIREFYGAAETSFVTLADEATPPASVGRSYPGVEIAIRAGEVWVKSPYMFEAYAGGDGSALREGDWLSVGEMGRIEDGLLYLHGRRGRMVTIADQNVFPEAIEAFLQALPGIENAAVLPEPDAIRGSRLYAVLQGDAGRAAQILAGLRAEWGPLKAPRRLVWRQDWPVLASGKTDLARLAREEGEA